MNIFSCLVKQKPVLDREEFVKATALVTLGYTTARELIFILGALSRFVSLTDKECIKLCQQTPVSLAVAKYCFQERNKQHALALDPLDKSYQTKYYLLCEQRQRELTQCSKSLLAARMQLPECPALASVDQTLREVFYL